jgi:hypothetical protein
MGTQNNDKWEKPKIGIKKGKRPKWIKHEWKGLEIIKNN